MVNVLTLSIEQFADAQTALSHIKGIVQVFLVVVGV